MQRFIDDSTFLASTSWKIFIAVAVIYEHKFGGKNAYRLREKIRSPSRL
jgi:hypothetical protein